MLSCFAPLFRIAGYGCAHGTDLAGEADPGLQISLLDGIACPQQLQAYLADVSAFTHAGSVQSAEWLVAT